MPPVFRLYRPPAALLTARFRTAYARCAGVPDIEVSDGASRLSAGGNVSPRAVSARGEFGSPRAVGGRSARAEAAQGLPSGILMLTQDALRLCRDVGMQFRVALGATAFWRREVRRGASCCGGAQIHDPCARGMRAPPRPAKTRPVLSRLSPSHDMWARPTSGIPCRIRGDVAPMGRQPLQPSLLGFRSPAPAPREPTGPPDGGASRALGLQPRGARAT